MAGAGLEPNLWEINRHWYWRPNVATFAVLPSYAPASWSQTPDGGALVHAFGRPVRVYTLAGYTVLVWHGNLLTRLGSPSGLRVGQPAGGGRLARPLNLFPEEFLCAASPQLVWLRWLPARSWLAAARPRATRTLP
jgi:hypothetical protein